MAGFEDFIGSIFGGFTRGVPPLVSEVLLPWANKVAISAFTRWAPIVGSNIRCGLQVKAGSAQRCGSKAIAGCACCNAPVCLDHAMVASNADVMCLRCANLAIPFIREQAAKQRRDNPGEDAQDTEPVSSSDAAKERKKHLKALGLEGSPDMDEIKAAYRKLVAKMHPDKFPEDERKAATRRFLKIQQAYDFLMDDAKKRAA